jgi:hypothetical protein
MSRNKSQDQSQDQFRITQKRLGVPVDELCGLFSDLVPEEGIEPSRGVNPTGF